MAASCVCTQGAGEGLTKKHGFYQSFGLGESRPSELCSEARQFYSSLHVPGTIQAAAQGWGSE